MRYFFEITYNGIEYHGWQNQPNAISVQQVVEDAMTKVFRAKTNEKWLIEFLYTLGRSKHLRLAATSYFTGSAGQQRVSSNFFKTLEIPLPSEKLRKTMVEKINSFKAQVKKLNADAEQLRSKAKIDFFIP